MAVQVRSHTHDEIARLVASGEYADAGEVIDAAVRLLAERDRKLKRLRAELAIGEEQERRGELIEMTLERFMEITDRAIADAGNGDIVRRLAHQRQDAVDVS